MLLLLETTAGLINYTKLLVCSIVVIHTYVLYLQTRIITRVIVRIEFLLMSTFWNLCSCEFDTTPLRSVRAVDCAILRRTLILPLVKLVPI